MDDLAKWLAVISAVFSAGTAWGLRRNALKHMGDRIDELRELTKIDIDKHSVYHQKHFSADGDIRALQQQAKDHTAQNDTRFQEMRETMKEMRDDIKEILKTMHMNGKHE